MPEDTTARDAIRSLVADYACGVDHGYFREVAALFTDDGVLELSDGRAGHGPAAIVALFSEAASGMRSTTAASVVRHHVTTHRIALEGPDTARGTAYFVVFTARGLDHWGTYHDRYVRGGTTWRFAARRVRLDGRAGAPWSAEPGGTRE